MGGVYAYRLGSLAKPVSFRVATPGQKSSMGSTFLGVTACQEFSGVSQTCTKIHNLCAKRSSFVLSFQVFI